MRGDRYGRVLRQVRQRSIDPRDEYYRVKLDKSGRTVTVHVDNICEFFER